VVVAHGEAVGDILGEGAEAAAHALADRPEGLEAGGAGRRLEADALGRAVVEDDEHRRLALAGDGGGQVGVRHRPDWAWPSRRHRARWGAVPVDGGARRSPDPAHPGEAVRLAGAGRQGAASTPPGQRAPAVTHRTSARMPRVLFSSSAGG
jgi:hypothetical protein